jgi:DNA-binding IclR family transcriptional regulator
MNNSQSKAVKQNHSVERVLRVMEFMAGQRGALRLHDIAVAAELPASTTLRFVNTLMEQGYAVQDRASLRYSLTFKLCRLAEQVRSGHQLRDIVRGELESLVKTCGESACLAVEDAREVVYIDVVEGPDSMLRTLQRIGKKAPLHSTGVGKSLLLNYDDEALRQLKDEVGFTPLTTHTITDLEGLRRAIDLVRQEGIAMDDEECELGVRCVAAPVRDYTGRVVCSISVSGPASRMQAGTLARTGQAVKAAARALSVRLGFEAPGP